MIVKLANINSELVLQEIESVIPNWKTEVFQDITIIALPDRIVQDAAFNEDGELVTAAVLAGETRYDLVVPDSYLVPELFTRVFPENSDHKIY